eukprot:809749-Pyramimonas_sp.AAC.1
MVAEVHHANSRKLIKPWAPQPAARPNGLIKIGHEPAQELQVRARKQPALPIRLGRAGTKPIAISHGCISERRASLNDALHARGGQSGCGHGPRIQTGCANDEGWYR